MENDRQSTIEEINRAAREDTRKYFGRLKMVPLIVVYQIWVVAVRQALGWYAAISACIVTACWIMGWPKGIWRNLALFLVMGLLLPLFLGVLAGSSG